MAPSWTKNLAVPCPAFVVMSPEKLWLFGMADENIWMMWKNCRECCGGRFCGTNNDEVGEAILQCAGLLFVKSMQAFSY
jgi:hypothetical protein